MSRIAIRPSPADEFERFIRTTSVAFSEEVPAAAIEHWRALAEHDRDFGAYEGRELVGTAISMGLSLRVPGGELPAAAVTAVGVLPTHRRRGILTALMRRQLDDFHERGEPLAILWSSEGGIYGRFGYGIGTRNGTIDADRDRIAIAQSSAGSVTAGRFVTTEEALELMPGVHDRVRSWTPGFPSRTRVWWEHESLLDEEWARDGLGPLNRVVFEQGGTPVAYALYRVKTEWSHGLPGSTLVVDEAIAETAEAERALWRFVFGVDLIARVQVRALPADHALFLLASEPSRLRFRLGDGMFVRPVDVAASLRGRSYAAEGALTLDVRDSFCPWNEARLTLDAGLDGSTVRRSRRSPDLVLGAAALGAIYLGGFSFGELARAGLVEEARSGAIKRAEAMFATERAPWCPATF